MISVNVIQAMLAPAVMISACGLLLLGMNNKYSLVIDRMRKFNDEKRHTLFAQHDASNAARLMNIDEQLKIFRHRVRLVRNAVVGYSTAVGCFILTSFGIGMQQWFSTSIFPIVSLVFFMIGMFAILVGSVFASIDAWTGYRTIMIETDNVS